jgi:hypothetical protein
VEYEKARRAVAQGAFVAARQRAEIDTELRNKSYKTAALPIGLSGASDGQLFDNNNQELASPVRGFA